MASNVALTGLARDLEARGKSGKPIRIGLIGSGEMGTDIVTRVAHMSGIEIGAISELNIPAASKAVDIAFREAGHSREVSNAPAMTAAMEAGKIAVTNDADLILNNDLIDVVIDATGVPAVGAEIGLRAMEHGKHLVMMNVEADVTIGAYLKSEADRLGVTYSLGAGDEPSSCMELIEFVSAMGHPIVAAGKGKNNPLNIDATPPDYEEEAERRHMNVRMLVEFVDGSKTMVEMAAIANATGLVPDKAGMHGPSATLGELNKVLVPEKDGGVLSRIGIVDYTIGKGVAPGVFVVADMSQKDMQPGEKLDAIGEYCYRAWIMTAPEAHAARAVPCGLLQGGSVKALIKKGELLTYANAAPAPGSKIAELRARQDKLVYGGVEA
jgi:predicted homoserine dehydrogenase-like protein